LLRELLGFEDNQTHPWTREESENLLIKLHLERDTTPVQGRSRGECESQWEKLYYFAFIDGEKAAIERYYRIRHSAQTWDEQETKELFHSQSFWQSAKSAEKDWVIHYYTVLGTNFAGWKRERDERQGDEWNKESIQEGIWAVVVAYHENKIERK
jgi:hypothetical protein